MRRNSTFVFLFLAVVFSLLITNCKKDKAVPEPDQINKFIWNGLRDYYLWVDNVPNLTNARFQQNDRNNDDLKTFLNQYTDHEKLFHDLLYKYKEVDK